MVVLDAYIVTHVGTTAIVQLDGGMLTVDDRRRRLPDGSRATVTARNPLHARRFTPEDVELGDFAVTADNPRRGGTPVLLQPVGSAAPIPLFLAEGLELPPETSLTLSLVPSQPDDEGGGADPDESNPVGALSIHFLHVTDADVLAAHHSCGCR